MKTLSWIVVASIIGVAGGVALGYWEARPWTIRSETAPARSEAPPAAPGSRGRAVVPETTYNFGKMESGAKQRRTFPIRNEGTAPLTVEFVSHTCKCTTVELNGKPVEPGNSVTVAPGGKAEALLEWRGATAGPFRHGAAFNIAGDPKLSRLELNVEGEIVDSTTLVPSQLVFGNVRVGETAQAEVVVMSFLEPDVQILSHEVKDAELAKRVKVTVEPVAKDKLPAPDAEAGARIVATLDAGDKSGPLSGELHLKTNLKQFPNRAIPIVGTVKGDISIFGAAGAVWIEAVGMLRMAPATSAEGGSSRLTVAIRGEHAATTKVSVARVDPPELRATLGEPTKIGDNLVHVPLAVEIPPGTRPMVRAGENDGGEGEIILATTHPTTSEVRLRVTFTVK